MHLYVLCAIDLASVPIFNTNCQRKMDTVDGLLMLCHIPKTPSNYTFVQVLRIASLLHRAIISRVPYNHSSYNEFLFVV